MADTELVRAARAARAEHEAHLLSFPNVVGVGVGLRQTAGVFIDEVCVHVLVATKVPVETLPRDGVLPREVVAPDGQRVAVDVRQVGAIVALGCGPGMSNGDGTRYDPVVGGCNIGRAQQPTMGGTLGAIVLDAFTYAPVGLTNNHVVTEHPDRTQIPVDSQVEQPSHGFQQAYPANVVGFTTHVHPIHTGPTSASAPSTDADVAKVALTRLALHLTAEVGIGPIWSRAPELGGEVLKRGYRTCVTTGRVIGVDYSIYVDFTPKDAGPPTIAQVTGISGIYNFDGGPFSLPGDSGSVVVENVPGQWAPPAVGLLFSATESGSEGYIVPMKTAHERAQTVDWITGIIAVFVDWLVESGNWPVLGSEDDLSARRDLRLLADAIIGTAAGRELADRLVALAPAILEAGERDRDLRRRFVEVASSLTNRARREGAEVVVARTDLVAVAGVLDDVVGQVDRSRDPVAQLRRLLDRAEGLPLAQFLGDA